MQHIQIRFFVLALLAVIFMSLVGVMLAEKKMLLATLSGIAALIVVGYGFIQKSKLRKTSSSQQ